MKPERILYVLNAALFFALIIGFCAATIFEPKQDFSELENRYLTESPKLNAKSWFSGGYAEGLSEYCREHFALRTRLITLRTVLEQSAGHDLVNGVYICKNRCFEAPQEINYEDADKAIEAVNAFAEGFDGNVSLMLVPSSAQIYTELLPDYAPLPQERRLMSYVYDRLSEGVSAADVYDVLYNARADYIYYRSDHHWTTYGAYLAYCDYIKRCGYEPVGLDRIDIEHASHDFLGSYYSKVLSDRIEPDTVDLYSSGGAQVTAVRVHKSDGSVEERDGVYFRENLEKKDKYLTFLGENVPLVEIESDAGGGSVLVIKDSFANCFAPFLAKHFSKVDVLDLRYMMNVEDYADVSEYDRVLILYSAPNFASDRNILKLGR